MDKPTIVGVSTDFRKMMRDLRETEHKVFDIIITHSIAEGHPRLCQTVQCGIFYSYSSSKFYKV